MKAHVKRNEYRTYCGIDIRKTAVGVVELPEEATCHMCKSSLVFRSELPKQVDEWAKKFMADDELDSLITKFIDYIECDKWHIHDGTGEHEGQTPDHRTFDEDKFKVALNAYINKYYTPNTSIDALTSCIKDITSGRKNHE